MQIVPVIEDVNGKEDIEEPEQAFEIDELLGFKNWTM